MMEDNTSETNKQLKKETKFVCDDTDEMVDIVLFSLSTAVNSLATVT